MRIAECGVRHETDERFKNIATESTEFIEKKGIFVLLLNSVSKKYTEFLISGFSLREVIEFPR